MNAPSLFDQIAAHDDHAIHSAHRCAIVAGLDAIGRDARIPRERTCRTLMCLGVEHLLNVAVTAEAFEVQAEIVGDPASFLLAEGLGELRDSSARATCLLVYARDLHGRDCGCAPGAWEEQAARATVSVLEGSTGPLGRLGRASAGGVARAALLEVTSALLADEHDSMAVPGHLAAASGYGTALFMLACELLAG